MSDQPNPQEERRDNVQRDDERPDAEHVQPARELSDEELGNVAGGSVSEISITKLMDKSSPKLF